MSVLNLSDFEKLMDDVRTLTKQFEELHAAAPDSKEKDLLAFAIASIKEGTEKAVVDVPRATQAIEEESRRLRAEGKAIEQQLAELQPQLDAAVEAENAREAERAAKAPKLDEMIGPVEPIDTTRLSADLFRSLNLEVPPSSAASTTALGTPGKPREHGDLWDWLK